MKKSTNLAPYTGIIPYASEIFGVYQPMLGWRSQRIQRRIAKGFANDKMELYEALYEQSTPHFAAQLDGQGRVASIAEITPSDLVAKPLVQTSSFLVNELAKALPKSVDYDDGVWETLLSDDKVQAVLNQQVVAETSSWYERSSDDLLQQGKSLSQINQLVAEQLTRESKVAGHLLRLRRAKNYTKLRSMFYANDTTDRLIAALQYEDPLDVIDPSSEIDRVSLSPIGIVHLFRQYFFELDTFLGPSVQHVWLSPGATVELMEVSTRKTIIERTFESSIDTTVKTEKSTTEEDELSEAVKQSNQSDTKFGMNATAHQSWIGGSASASASIDLAKTQVKARETTHRHMRQQTEKLSTEIRRNYTSTFRTVSEITDVSSKRFVLSNNTPDLLNYELRRKMRQVGVQVQDIGTYLCWQTYVDDPGKQLGVAELIHASKKPDLSSTPPPESIPLPEPTTTEVAIDIPFVQTSKGRGDLDEGFKNGVEVDTDMFEGDRERIQAQFDGYTAICDQPGYEFESITWDLNGNDVRLHHTDLEKPTPGKIKFGIYLDYVNFRGNSPIRVTANIRWVPTDATIKEITTENEAKFALFTAKERRAYEEAFVKSARERIKLASNIEPRKFEELRDEERIVVYRSLIQDMLTKTIPAPDDRTRHVVSELINTIFDVDKMLYFVAPEWWRPRLHQSHQDLGAPSATNGTTSYKTLAAYALAEHEKSNMAPANTSTQTQVAPSETVSWGGSGEGRKDNYYITEDSATAKLGSSLGWLLQLDGDNMRNAFLNAPWVKAVIPIRPGKERAAMNWLQQVEVEGTEGLADVYIAPPDELASIPHGGVEPTVLDAINHLCDVVKEKHEASLEVGRYPTEEVSDDNKVSATPLDKVYEHGFYPLQGGFRAQPGNEPFEVFDQWIEVLPTDQIVPVEVSYDPKTGRQV